MSASEPEDVGAPDAGMPSEFAADIMARQPFRGYELTACLAADDRRAVFKATDRNMDRTVAVKVMRPFPGRAGVVEEFFSLAGSIARLRCAGAVRGLDAGRGDGDFFLAYEFAAGESLAAKLARRQTGRLTEKESLKTIRETAGVLHNLFELGHPHGNLKPANLVLGDGGKAKLLDIGFAWTLAWPDDQAAFAACPDFLPPERIREDLNVDIRGDLYSLGAIWHWLLTGEPVFRGLTPADTLAMHLEKKPVSVRELDPRLSAATANLVLWLMKKDRDARPRTPREFLRKLRSHPLLQEEGGGDVEAGDEEAEEGASPPAEDAEEQPSGPIQKPAGDTAAPEADKSTEEEAEG